MPNRPRASATIAEEMTKLKAEVLSLTELTAPTDDQVTRSTTALTEFEALKTEHDEAVRSETKLEAVRSWATTTTTEHGDGARRGPEFMKQTDPFEVLRSASYNTDRNELTRTLIASNLKAVEHRTAAGADDETHFEGVIKRHARDTMWAMNLLARSRPEYETGWAKMMVGRPELLTEVERTAMTSGSNTNGGYLLPTHLDPTIMLTNSGSSNVIRSLSRVVTLTEGITWNGVTSAGVTASWDGELVEVSDDTPTFARVSVTAGVAQAFVQGSIASFEDIANVTSEVRTLFADARDRLEGAAHATGVGTGATPTGIVTALDASTTVEVTSTTAATIGEVDLHAVYRAVPVRWRRSATWLMNPLYSLAVKRLGTAVSSSFSGDLTMPVTDRILGRPSVESDDMPTLQTTTALDNEIVFGDFSNYLIVDKPGSMSVEFIPHLFATANNLPDGRRGLYAYWRSGANATNILAFRLLQDKTSA